MFYREIQDFEENFRLLDRLNVMLLNVWRDKQADTFRNGQMQQLEILYRNYISEMRESSQEMGLLLRQIEEQIEEANQLLNDIEEIELHPEIEGCQLYRANGFSDEDEVNACSENFVITPDESNPMGTAICECENICIVKNVTFLSNL